MALCLLAPISDRLGQGPGKVSLIGSEESTSVGQLITREHKKIRFLRITGEAMPRGGTSAVDGVSLDGLPPVRSTSSLAWSPDAIAVPGQASTPDPPLTPPVGGTSAAVHVHPCRQRVRTADQEIIPGANDHAALAECVRHWAVAVGWHPGARDGVTRTIRLRS